MIQIDDANHFFKIDTPHTSYVIAVVEGYAGNIYYGPKLCSMDLTYLLHTVLPKGRSSEHPEDRQSFLDLYPMEYPCFGTGSYTESCLNVIRDGQCGADLQYVGYELGAARHQTGMPAAFGSSETLKLILWDPILEIEADLYYSVFTDTDVIVRSATVINRSQETVYLDRAMTASLDMEDKEFTAITMSGAWAREHFIQRTEIPYGGLCAESNRGIPGHESMAFAALISKDCSETNGEAYGMNLIYSGSFLMKIQKTPYHLIRTVMGIHPDTFRWKLCQDESFDTPEAALVYSGQGLSGMTHAFHDFFRQHIIRSKWQYRQRPILVNSWEAYWFDMNYDKLMALAEKAQAQGIDTLVVDDGWFGHERSEPSKSLGDWFVNQKKIQGGLSHLHHELQKIHMNLGLWFEPEMISEDSDLYRAHPSWVMHQKGRRPVLSRDQWLLDFSNPEVLEYLYNSIAKVITESGLTYLKWDMNRPICDMGSEYLPADQQMEIDHRHILGVYCLQERLLRQFPDLFIENCSSGGARFDGGMLYYSPQIWGSDDMDPVERLSIVEGLTMVYPLSAVGSHVSSDPCCNTGRKMSLTSRTNSAMMGSFGYELDLTKLSAEEIDTIRPSIQTYKGIRELVQKGAYERLASYRENKRFGAVQINAKDQSKAVIYALQVLNQPNAPAPFIYLRGLDPDAVYEIEGKQIHGDSLMHAGYSLVHAEHDFQTQLLIVTKVNKKGAEQR